MSRPWMPLYIGDYLRDTRHLTTEQHGAYLLLIMHYWTHGGLPTDKKQIYSICALERHNAARKWRSICLAIAPFFDEHWRHKRIDAELEKHRVTNEKRAMAGRKGGEMSRGKTNNGRWFSQANAKQRGHQPYKKDKITSTEYVAAREADGREAPGEPPHVTAMRERLARARKGKPQ